MEKKSGIGRPKKEVSQLRQKRVNLKFTYDEYINLIKKKPSHLNDSVFIRESLLKKNIVFIDFKELDSLVVELKKIGVNINQIAKKINSLGSIDSNDEHILLSNITDLNKLYYDIISIINDK